MNEVGGMIETGMGVKVIPHVPTLHCVLFTRTPHCHLLTAVRVGSLSRRLTSATEKIQRNDESEKERRREKRNDIEKEIVNATQNAIAIVIESGTVIEIDDGSGTTTTDRIGATMTTTTAHGEDMTIGMISTTSTTNLIREEMTMNIGRGGTNLREIIQRKERGTETEIGTGIRTGIGTGTARETAREIGIESTNIALMITTRHLTKQARTRLTPQRLNSKRFSRLADIPLLAFRLHRNTHTRHRSVFLTSDDIGLSYGSSAVCPSPEFSVLSAIYGYALYIVHLVINYSFDVLLSRILHVILLL